MQAVARNASHPGILRPQDGEATLTASPAHEPAARPRIAYRDRGIRPIRCTLNCGILCAMDDQLNNIEATGAQFAAPGAEIDDGDDDAGVRRERARGVAPPIPTLAEALLSWR